MASRFFAPSAGGGRSTLDVPVAALAGLAVAVLAFAAPADLLGQVVSATGLPSIVAAAEPPLGFKARIGLGAGGAFAVFAITFLLLRWLERSGRRRPAEEPEMPLEVEAPRLRRRDIHPDAPARPPLLAAHELGEPDLDGQELTLDARAAWPSPVMEATLDPQPMSAPEPTQAAAPVWEAPTETAEPIQIDDFNALPPVAEENDQAGAYALSQSRWSDVAEPDTQIDPIPVPAWQDAPAKPPQPEVEAWTPPAQPALPPEPAREQAAENPNPWSPAPEVPLAANEDVAPRPQPGSIADLMERLEQGLARRRIPPSPIAETPAEPEPSAAAPPADDRLQSAIESLQRFASRQD